MITVDKARLGFCQYVENELAKDAEGIDRWNVAFACVHASAMIMDKVMAMTDVLQEMGYMGEDGMLDIDRIYKDYLDVAMRLGPVVQFVPFLGDIEFTAEDVTSLYDYMRS